MRVYKTITMGARLQERYDQAARIDTSSMRDSLERIEQQLKERDEKERDEKERDQNTGVSDTSDQLADAI